MDRQEIKTNVEGSIVETFEKVNHVYLIGLEVLDHHAQSIGWGEPGGFFTERS
jgi:hypothetical protein